MNAPLLNVQGATKRFGKALAVDGADLQIERGRKLALLGPSGCGKTTLLRLIAGFEYLDDGRIELDGKVLSDRSTFVAPEKRRIGMLFQDYALFPHLNVSSNVAFGLAKGGDRKKRVDELLDLVGLNGMGNRMPHELSGGEQQRVALARTLAPEPIMMLLDEPFSNLDPHLRARVRFEVRQIIDSLGMTAIFVTHDQEEALSLAEDVAVMLSGRILQVGHPEDVYVRPHDRRVAEFLGDANFLPGTSHGSYIETLLGRVETTAPAGDVELMVRPEDLRLAPGAGQPVQIVSREYYGHDQMVTVRLGDGLELRVRTVAGPSIDGELGVEIAGRPIAYPRPTE